MASYILRKIDPEFWQQVRAKAAAEDVRIHALILRLLQQWVNGSAELERKSATLHEQQIREAIAMTVDAMAQSHYARDITGQLALMQWGIIAKQVRELGRHSEASNGQ